MSLSTDPSGMLKDAEVRKYFLSVLQSNLSADEKYAQFIQFFELENQVRRKLLGDYGAQLLGQGEAQVDKLVSEVSQQIGIWNPEEILQQTSDSIRRAITRLKVSQHRDGGWGFAIEVSSVWGTAYSVLCLNAARKFTEFDLDIGRSLERGVDWLKRHRADWSVEGITLAEESRSIYDLSAVVRCFSETGEVDSPGVEGCWRRLVEAQNADGGWDAGLWSADYRGLVRVYSETGATSFALQALDSVSRSLRPERGAVPPPTFHRALRWLLKTQNEDGSWNNRSCTPDSARIEGEPSITKSCDAILAIHIAKQFLRRAGHEVDERASSEAVDRAVCWLLSQEKPIRDGAGNIIGWGWEPDGTAPPSAYGMETWFTLETLVSISSKEVSLPLLTANARWLMRCQRTEPGSLEDGSWVPGHTARIALSLIRFYRRIRNSPLFEELGDER